MSTAVETEAFEETSPVVQDVVNNIKSQGLFDEFRKQCLADVDTKPAYTNLKQRVEAYVGRFLSTTKWSENLNKNQLRESLRKQIDKSGMLNTGVERIIDQVVNPKIFQVIKPKIDEAVCKHLGIDPKEYQEWQQRRKLQQQMQQQAAQQAHQTAQLQTGISPASQGFSSPEYNNMMMGGFTPTYQTEGSAWIPGQTPFSPPNLGNPPPVPFGSPPFAFGMMPQPFPYGWPPGANPYSQQVLPPMNVPPPPLLGAAAPPGSNKPGLFPPPTNIPPPNMFPDVSVPPPNMLGSSGSKTPPPPGTVDISPVVPGYGSLVPPGIVSTPPTPSHIQTLANTAKTPLPVPVPIPTPPSEALNLLASVSSHVSCLDSKTDVKLEPKTEPFTPPPPPEPSDKAEVKAEDESEMKPDTTLDEIPLPEIPVPEDVKVEDGDQSSEPRRYNFAWSNVKKKEDDEISDVSVSSIHTSDLSSFEDDEEESESESEIESEPEKADVTEDLETEKETEAESDKGSPEKRPPPTLPPTPPPGLPTIAISTPSKPRKLLALTYNISDSEDGETREERKSRIAKEKEERYLKRQQRRAELEAKRKDREEEKARLREEKKKAKESRTESSVEEKAEDAAQANKSEDVMNLSQTSVTSATSQDEDEPRPGKKSRSRRPTKEQLKEQLLQQKMEKKLALRRQRTRNRRYASEEFESIFSEKRQPFGSQSYSEDIQTEVVEEMVELDTSVYIIQEEVEVQATSPATPTQDEQFNLDSISDIPLPEQPIPIVEVAPVSTSSLTVGQSIHATRSRGRSCGGFEDGRTAKDRAGSPYSDISDTSSRAGSEKTTPRRRRYGSGSGDGGQPPVRRSQRTVSPNDEPPVARRGRRDSGRGKSPDGDSKVKSSQRYSTDDLYKPRISHRRPLTPPAALEASPVVGGLRSGRRRSSPVTPESRTTEIAMTVLDSAAETARDNQDTESRDTESPALEIIKVELPPESKMTPRGLKSVRKRRRANTDSDSDSDRPRRRKRHASDSDSRSDSRGGRRGRRRRDDSSKSSRSRSASSSGEETDMFGRTVRRGGRKSGRKKPRSRSSSSASSESKSMSRSDSGSQSESVSRSASPPPKERKRRRSVSLERVVSLQSCSDISSESDFDDVVDDEGKRNVGRTPINQVDFGEAEKRLRQARLAEVDFGEAERRTRQLNPRVDPRMVMEARLVNRMDNRMDNMSRMDTRIDTRIDARIDTRIDTRMDARIDTRMDARIDTRIDARIDTRIDTRMDTRIDTRMDARMDTRMDNRLRKGHMFFGEAERRSRQIAMTQKSGQFFREWQPHRSPRGSMESRSPPRSRSPLGSYSSGSDSFLRQGAWEDVGRGAAYREGSSSPMKRPPSPEMRMRGSPSRRLSSPPSPDRRDLRMGRSSSQEMFRPPSPLESCSMRGRRPMTQEELAQPPSPPDIYQSPSPESTPPPQLRRQSRRGASSPDLHGTPSPPMQSRRRPPSPPDLRHRQVSPGRRPLSPPLLGRRSMTPPDRCQDSPLRRPPSPMGRRPPSPRRPMSPPDLRQSPLRPQSPPDVYGQSSPNRHPSSLLDYPSSIPDLEDSPSPPEIRHTRRSSSRRHIPSPTEMLTRGRHIPSPSEMMTRGRRARSPSELVGRGRRGSSPSGRLRRGRSASPPEVMGRGSRVKRSPSPPFLTETVPRTRQGRSPPVMSQHPPSPSTARSERRGAQRPPSPPPPVTRRQRSVPSPPLTATVTQRETRSMAAPVHPQTRSRREKSPPGKRPRR